MSDAPLHPCEFCNGSGRRADHSPEDSPFAALRKETP